MYPTEEAITQKYLSSVTEGCDRHNVRIINPETETHVLV